MTREAIATTAKWDAEKRRLTELFRSAQQIPALGDCTRVDISGPIHVSPHARLFLCRVPDRSDAFLAKCCYVDGTDQPDVDEARTQYEALVHLNRTRGDASGFNLIQPFHLFADQAIVVQSWIEGISFDRALADKDYSPAKLMEIAFAAGMWLGHFHRFDGRGTAPVPASLMDEIVAPAQRLGRQGRALSKAVSVLRGSSLAAGTTMQPVTLIHCDFKPSNVIAARDGVYAIDFQLSTRASVCFDLAHFLNSLAIDLLKARRPGLLLRSRQFDRAFVSGYESVVVRPVDPLILAYYLIYDLSRYMVRHGGVDMPGAAAQGKWWLMERLLLLRLARFKALDRRHTIARPTT